MAFIVKITTTKSILDWLCPHSCMGCGVLGEVLCECCKKDIISSENNCPVCQRGVKRGRCEDCKLPFDRFYMAGWRDELMGKAVEAYKYQSKRALAVELAEIMAECLPVIDGEVVIVPLPTIRKHVRARGFDHTLLVVKKIAKIKGWKCERLLVRKNKTVQVGAGAKKRLKQAQEAYAINGKPRPGVTYVLFDDVWTTGASMRAAERVLKKAGAKRIMGAVLVVSRRKLGRDGANGTNDEINNSVS